MTCAGLTTRRGGATRSGMKMAMMLMGCAGLGACVNVKAPDKPIEINLNINVKQEVIVSLRDDVKNLAQQYPGVF